MQATGILVPVAAGEEGKGAQLAIMIAPLVND